MIDVFYEAQNGKKYKLHEKRYKLQEGKTLDDFLVGDATAAIPSPARPSRYSLSERMKLVGETALEASVRAIKDEPFGAIDLEGFPNWRETTLENMVLSEPAVRNRLPQDPGNSYKGLASRLEEVCANVTFKHGMQVPIAVDNLGRPQRLYEYVADKGYVNLFEWEEIAEL
jgi:hypothetical protein